MVWALLLDLIVPTLRVVTPPATLRVTRHWTRSVLNCIPTQSVGTMSHCIPTRSVGTIKEYL